jgi:hypothetical protein
VDFEVHEIQEALEDIQQFRSDRPEAKAIGMINPAICSIANFIQQKESVLFKSSLILLTNTRNNCHLATEREFNEGIPGILSISNQNFKPITYV